MAPTNACGLGFFGLVYSMVSMGLFYFIYYFGSSRFILGWVELGVSAFVVKVLCLVSGVFGFQVSGLGFWERL